MAAKPPLSERPAAKAVWVAVAIAAVLGVLHVWGLGLKLLFCLGVLIAFVAWALPWIGVRWLDALILFVRGRFWAREQGRFHSFGGVPLHIHDDGRHVWVDGAGLQRAMALGRIEPDESLAARHTGHWQRDDQGRLLLRVDAVVRHLATMPGRDEPRVVRLRRYFERDVIYPAQQRRHRDAPGH